MSSVLETFYMLFESNAKEAAADLDKVEQAADGAAEGLGETADQATDASESFVDMIGKLKAVVAGYVSLKTVQAALNLTKHVDLLGKNADMWGQNVSQMDAWGQAAVRNGGSLDGFMSSIEGLNSGLNEIAMTGEGGLLPFFNLFGISAIDAAGKARDAFDVLPDIADQFERLSKSEQVSLGQQLGLDDGTIRMLQLGRRELELMIKKQQKLGTVTKEEAEKSADFNNALADSGQILTTLSRRLVTAALPALTSFLAGITDIMVFFNEHEELAVAFFTSIATVITGLFLPAMLKTAAATIAALSPFLLMAAAVFAVSAAIALLVDDFVNWRKGNDSVLGRVLGDWTEFSEMVGQVIDGILDRFEALKQGAKDAWGSIKKFFGGDDDIEVEKKILGVEDDIKAGQGALAAASSADMAAITSGAIANSSTNNSGGNTTIGDINVTTQATDAEGTAAAIGNSLKQQMRATVNTFDDGTVA